MRSEFGGMNGIGGGDPRVNGYESGFSDATFEYHSNPMAPKVQGYKPLYPVVATTAILGLIATACSGGKSVDQAIDDFNNATPVTENISAPVSPTQTIEPTATPTEMPTPTETAEPRVAALTLEELYPDPYAKEYLEIDGGGYFSGAPELENLEGYLYMDYSYEGQIRIIEASELDQNSWGFYFQRERKVDGGGVIPARSFSTYVAWEIISREKDVEIVWGDFAIGTTFFMSDELAFQFATSKISVEDVKKIALPQSLGGFNCTKVDSAYNNDGKMVQKPGTMCEYVG